ncbi:unnamed protein product, partial [marine sediment metagenome]
TGPSLLQMSEEKKHINQETARQEKRDRHLTDKMTERTEVWIRIVVAIVSGIVLDVWWCFIFILIIINWFYTLFAGKRIKELAELSEILK